MLAAEEVPGIGAEGRRHLTSSQKAAIAVQIGIYQEEVRKARERLDEARQRSGETKRNGVGDNKKISPTPSPDESKGDGSAASKTAERVGGTSKAQIQKAAWLQDNAPQELDAALRPSTVV